MYQRNRFAEFSARKVVATTSVALMCVCACVLCVQMYNKAYRVEGYDFTSYLDSAAALMRGTNPYEANHVFPYVYPLSLAFALIPLAALPYAVSNFLWFIANVWSIAYCARVAAEETLGMPADGELRHLALSMLILLALFFGVVQNNLLNGQANPVVLAACLLFFRCRLRGRHVASALSLATAISLKLTPAFLLIYLLVRREYRTAALSVILAVAISLLPVCFFGRSVVEYYGYYFSHVLPGLATNAANAMPGARFSAASFLVGLVPAVRRSTASILCVPAVILALLVADIARWSKEERRSVESLSLYLLAPLLASPLSETHHLIALAPAAISAFLARLALPLPGSRGKFLTVVALVLM